MTPARTVTPTKITAWLDCAHFLTLAHQVDDGTREAPAGGMGAFARLLADKGLQHEAACLAAYEAQGLRVLRVPDRERRESFAQHVSRTRGVFDSNADVLYQLPLEHDGIRGIADFLLRTVDAEGRVSWEPVDAKLARAQAKPGHVLQLCFYAEAIAAATGTRPAWMHLWLGSGVVETLRVGDFSAYWRRLRNQLATVLAAPGDLLATTPEPCEHCAFCTFVDVCDAQWRSEDSLVYVAGLRAPERDTLELAGVDTLAALAVRTTDVDGLGPQRRQRLVTQAALQRRARETEGAHPPYLLVEPGEDPTWGHGFAQLPEPDDGDVFLDFEGHPFWRADTGLFFLLGLIERDSVSTWAYRTWWAHTQEQEQAASLALIEHLAAGRAAHPGMHVYHYNHTERSSLERLATTYGVGEVTLAQLVDTGAFVDLFLVARNAVQVGTESYGLKHLERLTSYERGHDVEAGAGAVLEYEEYTTTGSATALDRIADYNEDDVRATRALRDWLVDHRPADLPWRAAELEPDSFLPELDEMVAALHASGPGSTEHLLGDVLGYWRREHSAYVTPLRARCAAAPEDLLDDPEAVAGLVCVGLEERVGKTGKPITPVMRFTVPEQDVSGFADGDSLIYLTPEGQTVYGSVARLEAGELDLVWNEKSAELGCLPEQVVRYDYVQPKPKPEALNELATEVLGGSAPNPVAMALLRRDLPAFVDGGGPPGGVFSDNLDEMLAWATRLDGSLVAIQGPPGTGKTYRGAKLVKALVGAGLRVGITAFSHSAIDNLLEAVVREVDPGVLRAVKRGPRAPMGALSGVAHAANGKAAANAKYNVVAGTTWLFAGNDMADAPVDVLLVDEAGQLALADALAACRSARTLILLGDPLQLPQVAQAVHPGGSGASVLEHLLGEDATMPPERGVFLAQTRRMHPDVATFISTEIYEGRLTTHPSCAAQSTDLGTGLRWLRAEHVGRSTQAPEEAEVVAAEIARLLQVGWTDAAGVRGQLEAADILVVAPYNDQVHLLRERLDADPATSGLAVGTVDKFQGREAAVVFFTMTSSSAADISRGADFLFSRNRLNVAVSRARCLAYLVCTEELLNSRGRDVEEMRLISTLCSFVEGCG
ncbi:TM0106 family RecB-like putative nuclease [Rhodococcus antarcticus]|uniref:TM0106 family RecB-like putative nuclease n=1 Tax=Rhodococcus antarcticus TaxID=2987751 RepID=A0ABY6P0T7_9NOCA|nr:TM0106 family RecB-like putative nuclease [Rhodococcus antarcticus]UZJ24881.1 TM0106 family RecB-like putative nuclease [Rhodococcus antarcticus]